MANDEHVALLKQGVDAWNAWRVENPSILPDLRGANLQEAILDGVDLGGVDLSGANLVRADLSGAILVKANLENADLSMAWHFPLVTPGPGGESIQNADFSGANLSGAQLIMAKLYDANLSGAILVKADLSRADLSGANLSKARLNEAALYSTMLVNTDLAGADLTGCNVFGVSAWGLKLDEATKQQDLVITPEDAPEITVDNIEVAQFIYLLLNNQKIRDVIDTVTSKAVLILGRFTAERKAVLDAIREELRRHDYLPILFDFDKPANRDLTETISLLARMARFIVADITDAKAIPQELNVIVPELPSVPVQPLLLKESSEYGMFEHYARYPWVLPLYRYETRDQLIAALREHVIEHAERKASELRSGARPIPPII